MKLTVQTSAGQATIEAPGPWQEMGPVLVDGVGEMIARDWLETTPGAFGHFICDHAAPIDLYVAGLMLQRNPRAEVQILKIEGEIREYDSGVPEGTIT